MNDAAIGAKTGIDLPQGKNLAGAFYPPLAVLADTATLATLPPREFRSGMAEVIKHGLIADPELLAACRLGPRRLPWSRETLVRRAAAVKIAIVRRDPFEAGERAALNAGHTVGHAIEVVSRYRIGHGPAVALGLVAEARLAERLGLTPVGLAADLADTFRIWGLGVKIPPGLDRDALLAAMQFDKKRRGKQLYLALPAAVGQMIPQVALPDLAPLADILRHDPLIN
jgi:3-dehydroquinate synthetase